MFISRLSPLAIQANQIQINQNILSPSFSAGRVIEVSSKAEYRPRGINANPDHNGWFRVARTGKLYVYETPHSLPLQPLLSADDALRKAKAAQRPPAEVAKLEASYNAAREQLERAKEELARLAV